MSCLVIEVPTMSTLSLSVTVRSRSGNVTGLSPKVQLVNLSDNKRLDFSDAIFKMAGHVQLEGSLVEVSNGFYLLNIPIASIFPQVQQGHQYAAMYSAVSGAATRYAEETIQVLSAGAGLSTLQNNMLLDFWRLHGLDPANPLKVKPTQRSVGGLINQNITIDQSISEVTVTRNV